MNEEITMALDDAKEKMDKAIGRLEGELSKIRAGKAHPSMLESVRVDYYGSMTPVSQVANVNSTDARTLVVQPWEKGMLDPIATGIINANLGLNPMNNGEVLIINVPPLTEERRRELSKRARSEGEGCACRHSQCEERCERLFEGRQRRWHERGRVEKGRTNGPGVDRQIHRSSGICACPRRRRTS